MAADGVDGLSAVGEQGTPTGVWGLDAEAQKGQETFVEDDSWDGEGEVDHDDPEQVGQQVAEEDADMGLSERTRGSDECGFPKGEDLAADDPGHGEPFDEA